MKKKGVVSTLKGQKDGIPAVPLTVEGWNVLHQMFRFHWSSWQALPSADRQAALEETRALLEEMEQREEGQSAFFSLLGHKGDLMVLHFRRTLEELNDAELRLANLKVAEFLEETTSYLSVVELGLYQATGLLYTELDEKGIQPFTPEWTQAVEEVLAEQRKGLAPRLFPKIPPLRHLCFYPMGRKRGETKNWYQVPMKERQRMLHEHGLVGRRYSGKVRQIISGSMGFDDWEWGVDLFADEPVEFKKIVYEMRFDEVSAVYALFGSFYVGLRFTAAELGTFLDGRAP
ncbi:MAG: hydrogen peroxide-dependent heme synthase, partial [Candidatus Binatia bacterium]